MENEKDTAVTSTLHMHYPNLDKLNMHALFEQGQRIQLAAELWRHAKPSPQCDVLVTLPKGMAKATATAIASWLLGLVNSNEPGLRCTIRHHRMTDSYGLYFTAEYITLLKGAELLHLRKPLRRRYGGGVREFSLEQAGCFDGVGKKHAFLTAHERATIVKMLLDGIRAPSGGLTVEFATAGALVTPGIGSRPADPFDPQNFALLTGNAPRKVCIRGGQGIVPALLSRKCLEQVLPIHERSGLAALASDWLAPGNFASPQPLDRVRDYFGTQIAMYFAWLGLYTKCLGIPAVVGMVIWWFGVMDFTVDKVGNGDSDDEGDPPGGIDWQLISDVSFVAFALFNCIWSTTYLELWKRRQSELSYLWSSVTTVPAVKELVAEPRPTFKADNYVISPISGRLEGQCAKWKLYLWRFGVSAPVTAACIGLMTYAMFLILKMQDFCNEQFGSSVLLKWIAVLPLILYSLLILAGDAGYRALASFLNDKENYRTDDEYENALIIKIICFQCVSNFGSLFYIAFYMQDMQRLRATLATLFITRQVVQNCVEVVVPYLVERFKVSHLTYKMTKSMSDTTLHKHVESVKNRSRAESTDVPEPESGDVVQNEGNELEKQKNNVDNEPAQQPPLASKRLPLPHFDVSSVDSYEITHAEIECLLPRYTSPLDDFLEMFIQFGYVLLFSPAFPLAALCALVNNCLEIRVDAFKLCNNVQRPFGRQVADIGAWQLALEWMAVIGVLVNCALIGQSGLVQRLWPDLGLGGQVLLVVVLESSPLESPTSDEERPIIAAAAAAEAANMQQQRQHIGRELLPVAARAGRHRSICRGAERNEF